MDDIQRLQSLALRSNDATIPLRDITPWVMHDIRLTEIDRAESRVWQIAAGLACAAALAAALLAIPSWDSMENPLGGVGSPLQGVMQ
jgi:hypothetical protein